METFSSTKAVVKKALLIGNSSPPLITVMKTPILQNINQDKFVMRLKYFQHRFLTVHRTQVSPKGSPNAPEMSF